MTLNELVKEAYALGFESDGTADSAFLFSANRALRMIYADLSSDSYARISQRAPTLAFCEERISLNEESLTVESKGVSYSFRYAGNGTFTVGDGKDARTSEIRGAGAFSGKLEGAERIVFSGSVTLFDLAIFSDTGTLGTAPIYSPIIQINLRERLSDVLFITSAPIDYNGKAIPEATVLGETLYLPIDYDGEIILRYKRAPRKISADDDKKSIDIPTVFEHLLPRLTAAYFWLDDDEEKSAFYMSVYRDETARIKRSLPKSISDNELDVTGWA